MATEENEAIVHRFVEEVMNGGNLDAAEDLIAPDHVNHDPTAPEVPAGPEGIKQLIGMYRAAFPDIRFETGEMISDGATVAHRWTFTGTHDGDRTDRKEGRGLRRGDEPRRGRQDQRLLDRLRRDGLDETARRSIAHRQKAERLTTQPVVR